MLALNKPQKTAEQRFRESFERIKLGATEVLPKGVRVSQNNVAKEAGCDPSALRKSRFPLLIIEIQEWIKTNNDETQNSIRTKLLKRRQKNRDTKEVISDLRKQRDIAVGMMGDANLRILELSKMVDDLRARLDALQPNAKILNYPNNKP